MLKSKKSPEEMIHEEVHRAMNEFLGGMQQQGISPEMYFQITGTSEDDLHKQYEADADKRVRTNLVIEAIAAAENFTTSDEEVKAEIEDLAGQYNMPVEQVEKLLPVDMLKHDIANEKSSGSYCNNSKSKIISYNNDKKISVSNYWYFIFLLLIRILSEI